MAVTSIWPVKGRISRVIEYARNPEKTRESFALDQASLHAIDGVVEYAADDMKTETREYVSCIRCREDIAAQQFMETKKTWAEIKGDQTLGGRICFHGYQSFAAGEVDANTAHQIGKKLAQRLWGNNFEVVIATHCNTGHYHNHFIINSVSWRDGHRFHNGHDDYKAMRRESDRLCLEYGISIIESPEGRGKNYAEWLADKNGLPTVRGQIRADIDRAIAASMTEREFFEQLSDMGYEIKLYTATGKPLKYPALKPQGAKGYFRFHKLGDGYSLEELNERILKNTRRKVPFPEAEAEKMRRYRRENAPKKKYKGLQALYIKYCFELGIIKKYPASVKRVPFFMKEDLTKLDSFNAQSQFLAENNIITIDDLNRFREKAKAKLSGLGLMRNSLQNELKRQKRAGDKEGAEQTKEKIEAVTSEMAKIRKDLRLSDTIEERSKRMAEGLAELSGGETKEEQSEQLFERSSRTGNEDIPGRD